jgi:hypothetical protein
VTNWKEPKRLQFRRHSNGRITEVYLQTNGRFLAREALDAAKTAYPGWFRQNISTLKLARLYADREIHLTCDSNCDQWQDDPHVMHDPQLRAILECIRANRFSRLVQRQRTTRRDALDS